jgi:hypothetical protein
MLLFATLLRESRLSINELLDCCNLCKYPIESGKRLLWISSWNCLGLSLDMITLWVIVDRLTKVAHFRLVKTTYTGPQLAELYMPRIKFWDRLPETMDIRPNFSSAYYPQTDGQTEQVYQIPEDVWRA